MNNKKLEQIIQGFNYSKEVINSIPVTGVENCKKIEIIYNNIDVFLNMIFKGEILITDNTETTEMVEQS